MSIREQVMDVRPPMEPLLRYQSLANHHIETLLRIEEEAYPDPWTKGMFRQELTSPTSRFYVAYKGEDLVGYGGFWFIVDEAHITKLTVVEPQRCKGYGAEILGYLLRRGVEEGATTARLEVRESNTPARKLYEQAGFSEAGLRKGYYRRTGESAVVMVKALC
jgi:ribosomal-protein-alanine N-acetyltransferase